MSSIPPIAATIARVLDARGSVILLETNWPGDLLGYLEHLGARHGRLPEPLARLIDHRVPRPSSFGAAELAETFPAPAWSTLASGPADIAPVRASGAVPGQTIPGFFAVLRTAAPSTATDVDSTTADGQT